MPADKMTLKDDKTFPIHEPGTFYGQCVDVIDMGTNAEAFGSQPPELKQKVALSFFTGHDEEGRPRFISQEYTFSAGKKANLRKLLESWRGKPFSDEEIKKTGYPMDRLEGLKAMVNVVHKTSAKGNDRAEIASLSPFPKGAPALAEFRYERPAFWEKRKAEYKDNAEKFLASLSGGAAYQSHNESVDDSFPEPVDPKLREELMGSEGTLEPDLPF